RRKYLAIFEREALGKGVRLENETLFGVTAPELNCSHFVLLPFFDRDRNICRFPVFRTDEWPRSRYSIAIFVDDLQNRILYQHFEVAIVLIESPDANFEVFIEFLPVVRLA